MDNKITAIQEAMIRIVQVYREEEEDEDLEKAWEHLKQYIIRRCRWNTR